MKAWTRVLCAVVALASVAALLGIRASAAEAAKKELAVGQVWKYRTRPGEENSRVTIGKIEELETFGTVVHVSLSGLKVKNASAPQGTMSVMGHAPVAQAQVVASVTELTSDPAYLESFQQGYETWLDAFKKEQAGVFQVELAELVGQIEKALNP
jgi:hypothetical protein